MMGGLLSLPCRVYAADWPQWRGPQRDGTSPEKGWFVTWPPEKVWTASVGVGYSSVVVSNGRAYATGHVRGDGDRGVDSVFCLAADSGALLWKHSYKCLSSRKDRRAEYTGPRATPLVDQDAVYTVSLEGHLFCLDAVAGDVRWHKKLNKYSPEEKPLLYGYCSSPVVHGETLLCFLGGAIMAFDRRTGKPLWRRKGGGVMWNASSPVIAAVDGKPCVVFGDTGLVGVNVENGKKIWDYPLGRATTATPVVSGNKIFHSTYPNRGRCGVIELDGSDPRALWTNRSMQLYHVGSPVLWEGHLYGIDCGRTEFSTRDSKVSSLKCIEFGTGRTKWVEKRMGWGQLIVADGKLLIQRECGELVAAEASPDGYRELGRAKVIEGPLWAVPALADGRIYCRNNKGDVVCVAAGKGTPTDGAPGLQGPRD